MRFVPEGQRPTPYAGYGTHGNVLVLNSGSSSLKYQLVNPVGGDAVAAGIVERIGQENASVRHAYAGREIARELPVADHGAALRMALDLFEEAGPRLDEAGVFAVGHRVVQGGAVFSAPVIVDDAVQEKIEALSPLAPLHNPANLAGITVARALLPDVPHVAVFDTAFFTRLPREASTYAIDREVAARHHVKRYGAHGTSHEYVAGKVARLLGRPVEGLNTIVLHIGNGASVSAVAGGRPVDTSMGLTPLEGLVMGTRTGDIDPAVVPHLYRNAGMSIDEIDDLLNKRSGLKGLAGVSDVRELHALRKAGDPDAELALQVYTRRMRKYIGAYMAVLGRVDVIAFTAGVGENDGVVRALAVQGLESFGIEIDHEANVGSKKEPAIISAPESKVLITVVPTMEELAIARQSIEVVTGA